MKERKDVTAAGIPEKNPNGANDVYKKNGSQHAAGQLKWLLAASIIVTIICAAFWIDAIGAVLSPAGRGDDYWAFSMLGVCVVVCSIWIAANVKDLYRLYGYRKKIMTNGKAYPGVVGEVQEYTRKGSAGSFYGSISWKKYSVEIKYAEESFWISDLDTDPRICLENPYCTVYVWDGKAIATDFKVKDAFLSKDGKTYTQG